MLIAFDIPKTVLFIVVYSVVIVHGFRVRCQEVQHVVIIKALHILVGMSSIIRDGFITIKPEACSFCKDHDYRVIPVNDFPSDEQELKIFAELTEPPGCACLKFCNISFTWS